MSLRRAVRFPARLAQVCFWTSLLVVAGLALYPDLKLPEPAATRGFTDKIYHVIGFAIVTALANIGWGVGASLVFALSVAAIGLELLQIFVHGRGVFLSDIVANFAGLSLGLLIIWLIGEKTFKEARH